MVFTKSSDVPFSYNKCIASRILILSHAFFKSIRHIYAGLLYSSDFSFICLITKTAFVHDLPVRNHCCSSCKDIRSFIFVAIILVVNLSVVFKRFIAR
ncbi:unnamed protein product [Diabrotica balteata]|uniref:Uncharacterized protein n=1 Tax=Diabrotica balteata TaxID=107213 RepID=A0A9N9SMD3_DIABA|nr:unnamed protein product [Diabrotica balteata]